ncbi:hypothetical protein Y032_0068g174 [Ancylostoma ceylanicum]|uniref:Uncharacterized protein n=1 Tax=Ancylostoma ceylanicum TaxID=53326 RepID=A0A016TYJ0_9BILA|nr:hypothetical protein Y032_0068g174 [Ancylostoma ceylanicum]
MREAELPGLFVPTCGVSGVRHVAGRYCEAATAATQGNTTVSADTPKIPKGRSLELTQSEKELKNVVGKVILLW